MSLWKGGTPEILDVHSDPYRFYFSYGQLTMIEYTLSDAAVTTVTLMPPGVYDPDGVGAIVLTDSELQSPDSYSVSFDVIDERDDFGNLRLGSDEGAFSFAIEATSPETGRTETRYGVVSIYN